MMDTLRSMEVFRLVVELNGFAAAARRLDLSPAMVSKHVMALEQRLGTRLLNRTSRRLSLTDDGAAYLDQMAPLLDGLGELEAGLGQGVRMARGLLRISAPTWFANAAFVRLLAGYRARHAEVELDIDLSGRIVNLVEEGVDLALRVTAEPSPTLIARPIAQVPFVPVASPEYLAGVVPPAQASDLARLALLWYSPMSQPARMQGPAGPEPFVPGPSILRSNSDTLLHQAALQGMGFAFLPLWLVAEDLAAGRLAQVLPQYPPQTLPLYAVYASRRHLAAKLRSFVDHLVEHGRFGA